MGFGECEITTNKSTIVLKENKSCLVVKNPRKEKITQIFVDGCAITDGVRCDHLLLGPDNTEYFVELKGCDIDHAIKQLETTIIRLGTKNKLVRRLSVIISSRCPLNTPKIQKLKLHFRKNLMSELKIKNTFMEISI